MVLRFLLIGLGGFFGAMARYAVSGYAQKFSNSTFPFGTLLVNVLGCLFLGLVVAGLTSLKVSSEYMRYMVAVGFLGAFTTFSTFSFETIELLNAKYLFMAMSNIVLNVTLCLLAFGAGKILIALLYKGA